MAPGKETSSLSSVLLQLLGAAAGLVVLMTLLGALGSFWRYKTLDLPNAPVAALSQTTLLIEGANELALPIGVGLLAAGASLLVRRYVRFVRWSWLAVYIGVVLGASALVRLVSPDRALYICATGLLLL